MRIDMYFVYLLLRLLALLPLRVLHGVGGGLGRLLLWRGGRMVRHTAVNLRIARPALDEAAQAALLGEVMAQGGRSACGIVQVWGAGGERALERVRGGRGGALRGAAVARGRWGGGGGGGECVGRWG